MLCYEHLLVRTPGLNDAPGGVVGTCRVLLPAAARRVGGLYSDIAARPHGGVGTLLCHPDWRTGGVILALWGALVAFMERHRLDTMIGCSSMSMRATASMRRPACGDGLRRHNGADRASSPATPPPAGG